MRSASASLLFIAAWAGLAHAEPSMSGGLRLEDASGPTHLTGFGDGAAFVLGGEEGDELWRIRGASTQLARVSRFKPPHSSDTKRYVTRLWETAGLLFAQVVVDLSPRFSSAQLWVSDGTERGTRELFAETLEGPGELPHGGVAMPEPAQLEYDALGAGNTFLIAASRSARELDSTQVYLWTRGGKEPQPVLGPESSVALVGAHSGRVYLRRVGELWAAEGGRLARILEDVYRSWPEEAPGAVTFRGARYEAGYDEQHGRELWRDGALFADLEPGVNDSEPAGFSAVGKWLLFSAATLARGRELWRTDGTASGTELLADLAPGPDDGSPRLFSRVGDELVFVAAGDALWATDGTRAGTVPIAVTLSQSVRYQPEQVRLRGKLIFSGGNDDPAHGLELWSGDGSPGGSSLLNDVRPGPEPSNLYALTRAGDAVYFVADDGVHGYGLWRTDGTTKGTVPVLESIPGNGPSSEIELAAAGRLLFFTVHQVSEKLEEPSPQLRLLGEAAPYPVRVFRSELWRTGDTKSGATLVRRWERSVRVQSNESPEGPLRIDTRENLVPMLPPVP